MKATYTLTTLALAALLMLFGSSTSVHAYRPAWAVTFNAGAGNPEGQNPADEDAGIRMDGDEGGCDNIRSGSITFDSLSSRISQPAQDQLSSLIRQMLAGPSCKVVVMGSAGGGKLTPELNRDRVDAVVDFLTAKNMINRNRFTIQYEGTASHENVDYHVANTDD